MGRGQTWISVVSLQVACSWSCYVRALCPAPSLFLHLRVLTPLYAPLSPVCVHGYFLILPTHPFSPPATGISAFGINVAVEILAGWKFVATSWLLQHSYLLAFSLYAAINLLLVLSSAVIVTRFAPAAAGSGIPEIKGYLNGE